MPNFVIKDEQCELYLNQEVFTPDILNATVYTIETEAYLDIATQALDEVVVVDRDIVLEELIGE